VFSLPFVARRLAGLVSGLSLGIVLAPAVIAASPTIPTLNPEPPDFYSCEPVGAGAICRAHTVEPYHNEPTGIVCGTGAGTFEILDSGTRDVRATRWYDANGDLTRRERVLDFVGAHLSNPLTGTTLSYHQHNTDWDVLAVPGDLSTATFHGHGVLSVTVPGSGAVLLSAGVAVIAPDGTLLHRGGQETFIVEALCAAFGA
jgi:hypothetical protein